jgi:hypothetical protein
VVRVVKLLENLGACLFASLLLLRERWYVILQEMVVKENGGWGRGGVKYHFLLGTFFLRVERGLESGDDGVVIGAGRLGCSRLHGSRGDG